MPFRFHPRRFGRKALVIAALGVAVAGVALSSASTEAKPAKPTIVLVHGAFADASGWGDVVERLQQKGFTVYAPANPLRGVAADADSLRSFLATIQGPIVLVAHSYGGFVTTNAATGNPNVKALVYVAAYGPDEGDSIAALSEQVPGGQVGPETLTIRPAPGGIPEGYIRTDVFRDIFAADLPRKQTAVMAASQRPASLAILQEPSGPPAWESVPSWYLVAGRDNTIGTELERFMAKRMGAHTREVARSSHVLMMSHPELTTSTILEAVAATSED